MRFILFLIGLTGLIFLIVIQIPSYQLTTYPPDFEGAAGIQLSEEATNLLSEAKANAIILVERQRRWQRSAIWLGFLGLGLTALATIIAGWKSRLSKDRSEEFLNKKITAIGALAAVATLATGAGELIEKTMVEPQERHISALKRELIEVPAMLASDPADERSILDVLEITLAEHSP